MSITEVCLKEVWVVVRDKSVCSLCIPKLEPPLRTGVEFSTTRISYDPFLLHLQVTEAGLVDDPRNDLRFVLRRDKIDKVPSITAAEDRVWQEGEGDKGPQ